MQTIATIQSRDREALFRNTARRMGMNEAIIEKDFWVCWTLDYLFSRSAWRSHLAFKGGTSLSKGYGLIRRFSEDIDLILDWRLLGYAPQEPWAARSNTKQDIFNKAANEAAERFLQDTVLPGLARDFARELPTAKLYIEPGDGQTIRFVYPQSFSDRSILQEIRLEIGALAAWTPAAPLDITPYAAQYYPAVFTHPHTTVLTVAPERTFWEKATILHREAYRPQGSSIPARYSRHYYDLHCMAHSPVLRAALDDIPLLAQVARFKDKFYRCAWARYDLARPGTLALLPPERSLPLLREDYGHMQNMLFGERPSFDAVMQSIANLEREINGV